jgi:TAP42-like family.
MADQPQSLRALFEAAKSEKQTLESATETNTDSYRSEVNATIRKFEECRQLISQLSLFSRNESLDDITTGDLQYVAPLCDSWDR